MKRYLLLSALLCAALFAGCGPFPPGEAPGNGVAAHGWLRVAGTSLVGEREEPVVLRGVSSHGLTWFPRFVSGAAAKTLREYGANVLRLAMYTEPSGAYLEDPERSLDYLYLGVESALSQDLYAIIDWHILRDNDPNEYREEAVAFFDAVSAHYADEPGVIYEICNEPNGDTDWDDVRAYAEQVIPVIRANSPRALVLVGVPKYCTDFRGPLADPLEYDNIMYVMHRYVDITTGEPCEPGQLEKLLEKGLPIFVSEWGVSQGEDDPEASEQAFTGEYDMEHAQPFLDLMKKHNVSWTAWALSNKDEEHSLIKEDCEKLSGWTQEDLTEFGRLIFRNF